MDGPGKSTPRSSWSPPPPVPRAAAGEHRRPCGDHGPVPRRAAPADRRPRAADAAPGDQDRIAPGNSCGSTARRRRATRPSTSASTWSRRPATIWCWPCSPIRACARTWSCVSRSGARHSRSMRRATFGIDFPMPSEDAAGPASLATLLDTLGAAAEAIPPLQSNRRPRGFVEDLGHRRPRYDPELAALLPGRLAVGAARIRSLRYRRAGRTGALDRHLASPVLRPARPRRFIARFPDQRHRPRPRLPPRRRRSAGDAERRPRYLSSGGSRISGAQPPQDLGEEHVHHVTVVSWHPGEKRSRSRSVAAFTTGSRKTSRSR